jgi:hypothetical protein
MSSNLEINRLEGEKRKHEGKVGVIQNEINKKTQEIKHIEIELAEHNMKFSILKVELEKEKAGLETIKSQIILAHDKAKIEEEQRKLKQH